jgi:hypothetical protein
MHITRRAALVTGAASVLLVGGGTAGAAIVASGPVSSSGVIDGCYTNAEINGSHVFVLQDQDTSCPNGTTSISWNQTGPAGPAGPAGATGPTGATGAQGPIGLTGAPGPTGPAGPAGPMGSTGPPGPAGPAGANGNTVLNGTGAPADTVGNDGDFYIDTAADVLYGPKANGSWPATGTSLVGSPGATGPAGPAGPQGPAGPAGATGPAGSSSLAALQGSPCTVGGRTSSLNISIDPTTGAVTMTCPPAYTVSATVTGGTMYDIEITDVTNNTGMVCTNGLVGVTSCSFLAPVGDSVQVTLQSGSGTTTGPFGSPFTYTCPGQAPQSATAFEFSAYIGICGPVTLTGDYNVTASF